MPSVQQTPIPLSQLPPQVTTTRMVALTEMVARGHLITLRELGLVEDLAGTREIGLNQGDSTGLHDEVDKVTEEGPRMIDFKTVAGETMTHEVKDPFHQGEEDLS